MAPRGGAAVVSSLARDVAGVTDLLPAAPVRLLVLAAVGLGGPPGVALAHLLASLGIGAGGVPLRSAARGVAQPG